MPFGDIVEIALRVWLRQMRRRRHDPRRHRLQANNGLEAPRGGDQMPGVGFGAGDRDAIRLVAQRLFQRPRFVNIVERRGGTVGVDIVEVGGLEIRGAQRPADSLLAGHAVFGREVKSTASEKLA